MSASDDDLGGEEDQLKQLRSVWVAMREADEDPPDRGLDALMAAARSKAADMAPPPRESFWTKVLATFRRPPVLALASVTVLLGGALFVAQRRDRMQATETAPSADVVRESAGSAASPPPETVAAPGSAPAAAGRAEQERVSPPITPVETPRDLATRNRAPARRAPAAETEKPAAREDADDLRAKGEGGEATTTVGGALANGAAKLEEAPGGDTWTTTTSTQDVGKARVTTDEDATRPTANATKKASTATPDTAPQTADGARFEPRASTTERAGTEPPVSQLVKQCESAAARKDCAAVRVLAKRIQAADPGAYKQRVAANTAIARCLAE